MRRKLSLPHRILKKLKIGGLVVSCRKSMWSSLFPPPFCEARRRLLLHGKFIAGCIYAEVALDSDILGPSMKQEHEVKVCKLKSVAPRPYSLPGFQISSSQDQILQVRNQKFLQRNCTHLGVLQQKHLLIAPLYTRQTQVINVLVPHS